MMCSCKKTYPPFSCSHIYSDFKRDEGIREKEGGRDWRGVGCGRGGWVGGREKRERNERRGDNGERVSDDKWEDGMEEICGHHVDITYQFPVNT